MTGPVTGGSHGWPFAGASVDLASRSYAQDEWFLEGEATRYAAAPATDLGWDGHWSAVAAGTASYRTRIIVMRPVDPAVFNGTAIVCWNNVSGGYDGFGGDGSPEILDGGYAYVAVSAQRVGVHGVPADPQGLTAWDPERYGSLSHPGDDFSFDIFTQAATAVGPDRNRDPDPMGGLDVQRVVAQGGSQSAMRLATYLNAVQPLAGTIDGFILSLYFGGGSALEAGDQPMTIANASARDLTQTLRGSHLLRDDLVPVMVVNSEFEATPYHPVRQPDSARFRYWEVAGTSHLSLQNISAMSPRTMRDFGVPRSPTPGMNEVAMTPILESSYRHLHRWLTAGEPPPSQPRIKFDGEPPEIVRDEHGLARGGVRLPQVEVPIACNGAFSTSDDIWMRMSGSCVPFPPETVEELYGDRETYLARFEDAAHQAARAGVLLARDVEVLVAEASKNWPPPR